jgi:hypothetical protein
VKPCKFCDRLPCFIHCIYCGVACDQDEVTHEQDCPSVTGIYPIREEDLGHACVHCHEMTPGMTCPKCDTPFKVGDFYCHQTLEDAPDDVKIIVCLTCAALSPTTQYEEPA